MAEKALFPKTAQEVVREQFFADVIQGLAMLNPEKYGDGTFLRYDKGLAFMVFDHEKETRFATMSMVIHNEKDKNGVVFDPFELNKEYEDKKKKKAEDAAKKKKKADKDNAKRQAEKEKAEQESATAETSEEVTEETESGE